MRFWPIMYLRCMKYSASLDTLARIVTFVTIVVLGTVIVVQFTTQQQPAVSWGVSVLVVAVFLFTYYFRTTGYTVTNDSLVIHRPASNVTITRNDIVEVSIVEPAKTKGIIRTFGVGGAFGYYGKFRGYYLGAMTWYATRRSDLVLIQTFTGKKIVVTPDDTEGFIAEFKRNKH